MACGQGWHPFTGGIWVPVTVIKSPRRALFCTLKRRLKRSLSNSDQITSVATNNNVLPGLAVVNDHPVQGKGDPLINKNAPVRICRVRNKEDDDSSIASAEVVTSMAIPLAMATCSKRIKGAGRPCDRLPSQYDVRMSPTERLFG